MNPHPSTSRRLPASRAFSLVEVVIALGIVSFALISIVGVSGTLFNRTKENADRQTLLDSLGSLRVYLREDRGFTNLFNALTANSTSDLEFAGVQVTVGSDGLPSPAGEVTRTVWNRVAGWTNPADYEGARVGPWVKARLSFASTNNQPGGVLPSGSPANYPHPYLVSLVEIAAVPVPQAPIPAGSLVCPIVLQR